MAKSSGRGKSDRQRIIEWYKSDLDRYRINLGEQSEFGTTITDKLIEDTQSRILELEAKEEKWKETLTEFQD